MKQYTRYEHSNNPYLRAPQASSKFPLSSLVTDDLLSVGTFGTKSSTGYSDGEMSPHSSQNPFGDSESGNTSGQDEFHLERYSESSLPKAGVRHQSPLKYRDESPDRRKKPGLNIKTDFSKASAKVSKPKPVIAHVPVQTTTFQTQPRNASGHALAYTSSQPPRQPPNSNFVSMSDLKGLSNMSKNNNVQDQGGRWPQRNQVSAGAQKAATHAETERRQLLEWAKKNITKKSQMSTQVTNNQSRAKVVIGISVPEDEVEAHRPHDDLNSALTQTPLTPSIIVTPAGGTQQWLSPADDGSRSRRPVSSFYSTTTTVMRGAPHQPPPVPSVPAHHLPRNYGERSMSRSSIDSWEAETPRGARPFSSETVIEDEDGPEITRPASSGSQEGILPSTSNNARPESRGWWNLMLSPMLSRAGTNATGKTFSPTENPPALPTPTLTFQKVSALEEKTPATDMSPETPRRAGLENVRASTWSNWSQWERDRDLSRDRPDSIDPSMVSCHTVDGDFDAHEATEREMHQEGPRKGLAAEYYETCPSPELHSQPGSRCSHAGCPSNTRDGPNSLTGPGLEKGLDNSPPKAIESAKHGLSHVRSTSDSTIIEDDPIIASPNVRKAMARPIFKARQPQIIEKSEESNPAQEKAVLAMPAMPKSTTPPPYSMPPTKQETPRFVGIYPPNHGHSPYSPAPMSPAAQKALHPSEGFQMAQVHQPAPTFINYNTPYPAELPPRPNAAPVSLTDLDNHHEARMDAESRRRRLEKEDAVTRRAGTFWRGRGCIPENGCFGRSGAAGRTKRRWYFGIGSFLLGVVIGAVVLATQLTRRGDQTPIESQWLNLTGFPPMPTGISTVGQPDLQSEVTACVQPSSLWSCALPFEDPGAQLSKDGKRPNFRLEIRFRNGTVDANGTQPTSNPNDRRSIHERRMEMARRANDPFTNSLFQPNPAPASEAEQVFLGNTTDNNTQPFNGEETPFFITFLTPEPSIPEAYNNTPSSRQRHRRQDQSAGSSFPAPAVLSDGTAAPANLLPSNPIPSSQPVRLYDRGLETEHYGFYTYFDKSVFMLSASDPQEDQEDDGTSPKTNNTSDPSASGNVPKTDANLRCTWSQTRFLVRIWTHPSFAGRLLPPSNPSNTTSTASDPDKFNSSATNFASPGTFPYPITITLDRHGGTPKLKGVYCYGMDDEAKIVVKRKLVVTETRYAGGILVNPPPGVFGGEGEGVFDKDAGGIDGGTGGCGCEWRNWSGDGSGRG